MKSIRFLIKMLDEKAEGAVADRARGSQEIGWNLERPDARRLAFALSRPCAGKKAHPAPDPEGSPVPRYPAGNGAFEADRSS